MSGAMLIAGSADLLLLFLGLELMVLPGYLLAGYHKTRRVLDRGRDQVLPARVVQLGAIFLFGLAFVWGLTGTTRSRRRRRARPTIVGAARRRSRPASRWASRS